MREVNHLRAQLDKLLAEQRLAVRQVEEERKHLKAARAEHAAVLEAQEMLQHLAQAVQGQAHKDIAGVVSRCLTAVFGEDAYALRVNFARKRGKTEPQIVFARGDYEYDPEEAAGHGQVNVACLALRLVKLVLSRPARRRVILADEPLKDLSPEYRPLVPALLRGLSEELGVQWIFSSNEVLYRAAGDVLDLERLGGP